MDSCEKIDTFGRVKACYILCLPASYIEYIVFKGLFVGQPRFNRMDRQD